MSQIYDFQMWTCILPCARYLFNGLQIFEMCKNRGRMSILSVGRWSWVRVRLRCHCGRWEIPRVQIAQPVCSFTADKLETSLHLKSQQDRNRKRLYSRYTVFECCLSEERGPCHPSFYDKLPSRESRVKWILDMSLVILTCSPKLSSQSSPEESKFKAKY